MQHENLTVDLGTGPDADGRNSDTLGDTARELCRNALEHHGKTARILDPTGLVEHALGRIIRPALYPVATVLVHRLRRHSEMAHHRDAGLDDVPDDVLVPCHPLHLDRLRASAHEGFHSVECWADAAAY